MILYGIIKWNPHCAGVVGVGVRPNQQQNIISNKKKTHTHTSKALLIF